MLDDLCAKLLFSVVETISVNTNTGTNFMDRPLTSMYSTERQHKPLSLRPIAVLLTRVSNNIALAIAAAQEEE